MISFYRSKAQLYAYVLELRGFSEEVHHCVIAVSLPLWYTVNRTALELAYTYQDQIF